MRVTDKLKSEIPIFVSSSTGPLDAAHAYYTEGENNIIRRISLFAELYPLVIESEKAKTSFLENNNTGDIW